VSAFSATIRAKDMKPGDRFACREGEKAHTVQSVTLLGEECYRVITVAGMKFVVGFDQMVWEAT